MQGKSQLPTQAQWPDPLQPSSAIAVEAHLVAFWQLLQQLPELVQRQEHLLAEHLTTQLRGVIIEMMLALNGIQWPRRTRHLNRYLSASQNAWFYKRRSSRRPLVRKAGWGGPWRWWSSIGEGQWSKNLP